MRSLCASAIALLVLTACSGGGDPDPGTSTPPEPEERDRDRVLTVREIRDALLTVDDLSDGFDGGVVEGVETSPPGTIIEASSAACEELWTTTQAERYADLRNVEAAFTKTDLGPFLHQHVIAADDATVEAELDRMAGATEACPSYTTERADGQRTAVELHPTVFPEVGDRSVTIERGITTSDGTNNLFGGSTTVFVAVGPHLVIVTATHYVDHPQFAAGELETIVRTAIAHLEDARA